LLRDSVAAEEEEDSPMANGLRALIQDKRCPDCCKCHLRGCTGERVSDEAIKVMLNPGPAPAPVVVAASPVSTDPNLPPPEVGVYWRNGTNFALVQGLALSQVKIGGRAESFFTNGMRSEHWDATIASRLHKIRERAPTGILFLRS
jgi:hypothetical protein